MKHKETAVTVVIVVVIAFLVGYVVFSTMLTFGIENVKLEVRNISFESDNVWKIETISPDLGFDFYYYGELPENIEVGKWYLMTVNFDNNQIIEFVKEVENPYSIFPTFELLGLLAVVGVVTWLVTRVIYNKNEEAEK
ncbi:MAG: hypothetical protein DRP11_02710 [Candidatus Aenigmatarchaeota archaeon]|nr:MAG: hypothetical protein DRP11_02710 [Candidatus Aenigmarchaeota archaeon]